MTTLRPATPDDVEAIATLWHGGWIDGHRGHVPDAPRVHQTTVAAAPSGIVGFVTVHDDEVEQIYVAASARGGGVAAPLLTHAEERIGARYDVAWLAVAVGNARARRFYERSGWRDAGALDYQAEIAGGRMVVPCRRYEKALSRGTR
jgi:ribosomal protein S18 acetylase RimI-like enzyme